jgi:hypothetical protein
MSRIGIERAGAIHEAPARARRVAELWYSEKRLSGLARFAIAITSLNILGHFFLGFEQSWATPLVSLLAAYGTELAGEATLARTQGRRPRFAGGGSKMVSFLLSAHISGLAVGMLLYPCEQLAAIAFASSLAVASKYVVRVPLGFGPDGRKATRHVLNPSNFGITATLVLIPTVGIAPPYQFTENTAGIADWLLPLIVIGTGSYLNLKATGKIPLILAWLVAFALQASARSFLHDTPLAAGLNPMTGFAFILFTFYMITDPATSPAKLRAQIGFAAAVAVIYGAFMEFHIVFGLFYALTVVTAGRGLYLWAADARSRSRARPASAETDLAPERLRI